MATVGLSWRELYNNSSLHLELLAETPSIEKSGVCHERFIVGSRCTFD